MTHTVQMISTDNNWYVITGAPCSGKTTLIEALEREGFSVVPEVARMLIDSEIIKGRTIQEIRSDEKIFQDAVLAMKYEIEKSLPVESVTFFDRGIPDSLAYYELHNFPITDIDRKKILHSNYKKIFILDYIPLVQDYARTETVEEQKQLDHLLEKAYRDCRIEIVRVPLMSVPKRVAYVKKYL